MGEEKKKGFELALNQNPLEDQGVLDAKLNFSFSTWYNLIGCTCT